MNRLFTRNFWLILCGDILLVFSAYWLAYLFRFEFNIPPSHSIILYYTFVPVIAIKIVIFYCFGLYKGMYRYTSVADLVNIIKASVSSSAIIALTILAILRFEGFSRSVYFIDGVLTVCFIGGFHVSIRFIFDKKKEIAQRKATYIKKDLLIIGAGDAGEKMLREIKGNANLHYNVLGFLDDDKKKHGKYIHDVKIIGGINKVTSIEYELHKKLDEILIALPSVNGKRMREIINLCQKTKAKCRTIPGIAELINGRVTASAIRDVSYNDLLGREPIKLDLKQIESYLEGKRVLITGAGGSIGYELCRQIAQFKPDQLLLFERTESALYDIEMELRQFFPQQKTVPVLGSATCQKRVEDLFSCYKPQVVFHAAAYKHESIIEEQPWEAIYNNVLGTKYILDAALDQKTEKFILISTDKAMQPVNVVEATKSIAEKYCIKKNEESSGSNAIAVRFGNVVGSADSVISIFKKQIADGGPVTISDPRAVQYFFTISDACKIILQAGVIGQKGRIYHLTRGEPLKIVNVARDLIRFSGYEPDKDIKIEFVGARSGEKMREELMMSRERFVETEYEMLMMLRDDKDQNKRSGEKSIEELDREILELVTLSNIYDKERIKKKIKEILPEYSLYAPKADKPFIVNETGN
ncbi:MAG: polysaccharide biosynthesis protein [bacterium]